MDFVPIILFVFSLLLFLILFFLLRKSGKSQEESALKQKEFNEQFLGISNQLLNNLNDQKVSIAIQNEKLETQRNDTYNSLKKFQEDINSFRKEVGDNLNNANKLMDSKLNNVTSQLQSGNKVIGDVKERFGEIMETTKQIYNIGKDISSLENILKSPKLRGNLGEYLLEDLLKQILPGSSFEKSYRFKSGESVDFAIFLGDKIVPVDSKFPLENFRKYIESESEDLKTSSYKEALRNVRKHIDEISKKYILPIEDTFDFAMMYIPAENVYYETIIRETVSKDGKSLYQYALEKRIIPVSPNSMFAYLQSILIGLKGFQIEKNAEEILKNISSLSGDLYKFGENFRLLGTHLTNATKQYDESGKRLSNFESKLENMISKTELDSGDESELRLIKGSD